MWRPCCLQKKMLSIMLSFAPQSLENSLLASSFVKPIPSNNNATFFPSMIFLLIILSLSPALNFNTTPASVLGPFFPPLMKSSFLRPLGIFPVAAYPRDSTMVYIQVHNLLNGAHVTTQTTYTFP